MNRSLRDFTLTFVLLLMALPMAFASARAIPLPELVKTSDSIVMGRIIKTERTELREGVHEVVCQIRVDTVLKGKPTTTETVILDKRFSTVQIQFWDGTQVPTGKVVYELGEEGIWFLAPIRKSKPGLFGVAARHDLSQLEAVRKELLGKQ